MKFLRVWVAEIKNSYPNHPNALLREYCAPHLLPKISGCITFKSLGTPSYLIKLHIIALHCPSKDEVSSTLGAEIKNSDPNHPKALLRVYYPSRLLPKIIGCLTFKSLWTPSYLIKIHIIALHCTSKDEVPSTLGAEIKNSDPNHPKALLRVYYPPRLLPKIIGCITFKLLGTPWYLIKLHIQLHSALTDEFSSRLGG